MSTEASRLSGCGLVVEAVPEQPDLKKEVPAAIETVAPDGWVATNTSSLSVDALAATLTRAERFIGLHFFNPVPASKLVETVVGDQTAAELVDLSQNWVADLGKTAITVTD
jgi:3-hydroxybutyryl-CoA dehydrogenase